MIIVHFVVLSFHVVDLHEFIVIMSAPRDLLTNGLASPLTATNGQGLPRSF
jgi:hypothetical protein